MSSPNITTQPSPSQTPGAVSRPVLGLLLGIAVVGVSFGGVFAVLAGRAGMPPLTIAFWRCALAAALTWLGALGYRRVRASRRARGSAALGVSFLSPPAAEPAALGVGSLPAPAAPELFEHSPARTRLLGLLAGACLAIHFGTWIASFTSKADWRLSMPASVLLVDMYPLLVVLGSVLLLGERPRRAELIGLLLCLGGAALWVSDQLDAGGDWPWPGVLLALTGAVAIAAYMIVGRALRRRGGPIDRYLVTVYAFAALLLLFAAVILGEPARAGWPFAGLPWAILLGVVPMALGHSLYNWALGHVAATVVATVALAEIIGAALLGAWLLATPLTARFMLAAVIITGGLGTLALKLGARQANPR